MHVLLFQFNLFEEVTAWLLLSKVVTKELDKGQLQHTLPLPLQGLQVAHTQLVNTTGAHHTTALPCTRQYQWAITQTTHMHQVTTYTT